jgi:hypothetical protein
MVVRSVLLAMVLVGCVEGAEEPVRSRIKIDVETAMVEEPVDVDVCGLASELDTNNVCSLICDPDAMADFLTAEGVTGGKCIQLRCELPGIAPVSVGVCLPP